MSNWQLTSYCVALHTKKQTFIWWQINTAAQNFSLVAAKFLKKSNSKLKRRNMQGMTVLQIINFTLLEKIKNVVDFFIFKGVSLNM